MTFVCISLHILSGGSCKCVCSRPSLPTMDRGVIATDATSTADEPDEKACQDDSCLCVFGGIELTY